MHVRMTFVMDNSGYGVAAKHTFLAMLRNNINISANIIITPMSRPEFAKDEETAEISKYINNKLANINIVELIPPLWHYAFQKNTRNLAYFFWETNKIPSNWAKIINEGFCSEVWVPCESNKQACLNSGVTKPIYVIPQYTKTNIISKEYAEQILPIPNKEAYKFYSIFQYTKRKNPEGIINAYLSEFTSQDNVMFVIKTYGPSSFSDRRWIKEAIQDIKASYDDPPPIFLFGELLKPEQIDAIHAQCQCYVYAGLGEGWNIPLIDAMAYGNQTITTKLGGISDWIEDSSYIIPHTMVSVDSTGMPWGGFYTPDQKWGDIKVADIQAAMRQAYNERNDFSMRSDKYKDILSICNETNVIKLIQERLANIL